MSFKPLEPDWEDMVMLRQGNPGHRIFERGTETHMVTAREKKTQTYKGAIVSLLITWRNQKKMELSCIELSW